MKTKYSYKAFIKDRRGNVLSIGENNYTKSHPLMAKYSRHAGEPKKIFLHAEIAAIVKCKDLSKARSIFIYRLFPNGEIALAEPCRICASAIESLGLKINK